MVPSLYRETLFGMPPGGVQQNAPAGPETRGALVL